jgi:prophage regulatory protein
MPRGVSAPPGFCLSIDKLAELLSIDKQSTYVCGVPELLGVAEIADLLGVSRQRVNQLVKSDPSFPKPLAELTAGRIWAKSDIERWLDARK